MKSTLIVTSVALLLVAGPRVGLTDNGAVKSEFTYEASLYNECLGEYWDVDLSVDATTQSFTTPSGRQHLIDNYVFYGTAVAQDSGLIYTTHGAGPFVTNSRGAQSTTMLELAITWHPIEEGPKILETWRFHFVVDANGMIRLYRDIPINFRCIGQGQGQ